jgi:hypothetical protein
MDPVAASRGPPGNASPGPVRARCPDHYGPGPERVTGALPLAGVNGAAIGTTPAVVEA